MSFLLGALPSIFGSPMVRNVIGGLANNIWNTLKGNAVNALTQFTSGVKNDVIRNVKPLLDNEENERMEIEEIVPIGNERSRRMESQRRRAPSINDKYIRRRR